MRRCGPSFFQRSCPYLRPTPEVTRPGCLGGGVRLPGRIGDDAEHLQRLFGGVDFEFEMP